MVFKAYKIAEIGKIVGGSTPSTNVNEYWDGEIPWICPSDLTGYNNVYISRGKLNITELGKKKGGLTLYPKGTVLLSSRAPIGYVAIASNEVCTNQGFKSIICDEEIINNLFLYYYLKQNKKVLENFSSGATFPELSSKRLKQIKIFIPDLSTQTKIASILSAYDDAIENNNKRIKILEQMAEGLYKEWFVRMRFPGYETAEYENGLPKGWEVTKLKNKAYISTGKCNSQDAEENGAYPLFDRSKDIKSSNKWLKDCEAIIVPGEGASFIPVHYIGKFNLHQRCYCIEPINADTGMFLYFMILLNRRYFLNVATGATVPSLRQNNFTSMKFIFPTMKICKKFNDTVTVFFDEINVLKEKNKNLAKQRDLLLPRLMSGKLNVD